MKKSLSVRVRWRMLAGVVGACAVGVVSLAGVAGAATGVAPGVVRADEAVVRFEVETTRARVGAARVIAFRVEAAEGDREFEAGVGDGKVLEVLGKARVVGGAKVGYVRVRGVGAGTTELKVGGGVVGVEVVEGGEEVVVPEVTSPGAGAVVWGRFAVGVELPLVECEVGETTLKLSNGQVVSAKGSTTAAWGPTRHVWFEVDADACEEGELELRGVYQGRESRAVKVRVARASDVVKVEAEAPFEGERPERFKRPKGGRVGIAQDSACSGGAFVNNAGAEPAVCIGYEVKEAGWYQAFITAASDFGGGAFPTVGLIVDGAQQPVTNARLVTTKWQRLALGMPVRLEVGQRVLTPYFLNDFNVGRLADRNLRLDCVEVMRVGGAGSASGGGEMMGGMEAMQGGGGGGGAMAADSMMGGGAVDVGVDAMGEFAVPLRVAFARVLEGQVIGGMLDVEAVCWYEGMDGDGAKPAVVSLLVNGEVVSSQHSASPRFTVDAGWFRKGENTVQLVARRGAVKAETPVQRLTYAMDAGREGMRFERFAAMDPRWGESVKGRVVKEERFRDRAAIAFYSHGEAELMLPSGLVGRYDVVIEGRSQDFKGAAIAKVRVLAKEGGGGGSEREVLEKDVTLPSRMESRRVETVELPAGSKRLTVEFVNDAYEEGKGDRNMFVGAVTLAPQVGGADEVKPVVSVEYPGSGAAVWMQDAVVASVADDRGVVSAELVVDGKETGLRLDVARSTGRVVLPLIARGLEAGRHTLAVKAVDGAKNETTSAEVAFEVLKEEPKERGRYERALWLLERFGFGPDAESLASVLLKGEKAWLVEQLSAGLEGSAGDLAAHGAALARYGRVNEVQRRALAHAVMTPNPVRARFVLWAQNHFSTWLRKTEPQRKWDEHVAFARLGVASFPELLRASAHSPAMLRYLDQEQSFATRLNENYAREIMELHTLGVHGGYSQEDVTNLAKLLTGWTVSREGDSRSGGEMNVYAFRFDPALNYRKAIRVVGYDFGEVERDGAYERVETAMEVLSAHPATARFVCGKLVEHYVGSPAPAGMVEDLAKVFMRTDGEMRAVMLAMAEHPGFWEAATRLAKPQDFGIRLARVTRRANAGVPVNQVGDFLGRTSHNLFDRPTPDGYSESDADYTDSNAMVQRWKLAQDLSDGIATLVPESMKREPEGKKKVSDEEEKAWRRAVIDVIAVRLTGRVLSERSFEAADGVLAGIEGRRAERIGKFAPVMGQLPEGNLR